jgi:hypothetical protein
MDPNVPFLTMRTTLKKIKALLEEWSKLDDYRNQLIPIVHTAGEIGNFFMSKFQR